MAAVEVERLERLRLGREPAADAVFLDFGDDVGIRKPF